MSKFKIFFFALFLLIGGSLSPQQAQADTFCVTTNFFGNEICMLQFVINLDKSVYAPNEHMRTTGSIRSLSCSNSVLGVHLYAHIVGLTSESQFWGGQVWGNASFSGDTTAPSVGGNYTLRYRAAGWQGLGQTIHDIPFSVSTPPPPTCPDNTPYTETNYPAIVNYCNAVNGAPPAGKTYPTSLSCNAAPNWQPYGPSCTPPSCACAYVPVPPPPPICTPTFTTETRTLACPGGQTGSVTESASRNSCTNTLSAWTLTGNSCITPVTPSGDVQGYKVNSSRQAAFAGETIAVQGSGKSPSSGTNPYSITGITPGGYTVTTSVPAGHEALYCISTVANNCGGGGTGTYTPGSSVSVTVPSGASVDVWWMYRLSTPPPPVGLAPSVNLRARVYSPTVKPWRDDGSDDTSTVNPLQITTGEQIELDWKSSNNPDSCGGVEFSNGSSVNGSTQTVDEPMATVPDKIYKVICKKAGFADVEDWVYVKFTSGAPVNPPTIRVTPSAINKGGSVVVSGEQNGHTGCSINGAHISGTSDTLNVPAGTTYSQNTGSILGRTTFTLTCSSWARNQARASVEVKPQFIEE